MASVPATAWKARDSDSSRAPSKTYSGVPKRSASSSARPGGRGVDRADHAATAAGMRGQTSAATRPTSSRCG